MRKPVKFGKYSLLDRINVGGMAEVFRAKTYGVEGFERLLAVKRILSAIAEDKEFISMFIDEAKIAVQLSHANICQIFDLGKAEGSFYIALEYVPGKDLRALFDRCKQRPEAGSTTMPMAQACFIIMKVCEGLDYAHNKKDATGQELSLVHRDVSPQNLIISYEGEVKLIDFGIAKSVGKASKTQAGILKGKFGYMSPEQVRGLPLDRRSDIFSVGIVLYELLTSERLFVGESDFATLEKVRNVEIVPPSTYNRRIPEELERIVLKALARDVDDRYQNAIDLHDDLQAFMYTAGEFYSRKDLSAWMKRVWAREMGDEAVRLEEYPAMPPQTTASIRKVAPAQAETIAGDVTSPGTRPDLDWELEELETHVYGERKEKTQELDTFDLIEGEPTDTDVDPPGGPGEAVPGVVGAAASEASTIPVSSVPTERPGSGTTGLSPILQTENTVTTAPGQVAGRPTSRRRGLWIASAGALILGLGTGAVALWKRELGAKPQQATWVTPTVVQPPLTAGFVLYSEPDHASAWLDGTALPNPTPLKVEGITGGQHVVEVRAAGRNWSQTVQLEAGKVIELHALLPVAQPVVTPTVVPVVAFVPPVAPTPTPVPTVAAAPRAVPTAPSPETETSPPRRKESRRAEAAAEPDRPSREEPSHAAPETPSRLPRVARAEEPADEPTEEPTPPKRQPVEETPPEARPERAAKGEGFLRIGSKPWTKITIDGKDTGLTTPQTHLRLSPGPHQVQLINPQFHIQESFTIEIQAGETETVIKDLRKPETD